MSYLLDAMVHLGIYYTPDQVLAAGTNAKINRRIDAALKWLQQQQTE
jgi:hypothetical protein